MRTTGTIIASAYIAVILAALVLGPLIILHGYRAWWLVTFYAGAAIAITGGIISRHRIVRRKQEVLTPPRATSDFAGGARHSDPLGGMPDWKSPFRPAAPQTSMDEYAAVRVLGINSIFQSGN